ncbi:MAG: hypothetical protein WCO47_10915 [Methylococcus sp.]|jgi:hypothetical protein
MSTEDTPLKRPRKKSVAIKPRPRITPAAPEVLDLIAAQGAGSVEDLSTLEQKEETSRFRIFVIDAGWKSPAAEVLRSNFTMILCSLGRDPLYVLTRRQSQEIIRKNPILVGKDPIILVRDLSGKPSIEEDEEFHGFHFNLGLIHQPTLALKHLQEFLHFLISHRDSPNIEMDIRQKLHHDGLIGTLEVIRSSTQEAVGA